MKWLVWTAYKWKDRDVERIAKQFFTEEEAKDWIWIRERIDRVKGETRVYWIEECF